MISIIVAMDQNCLIGRNNDLPWRLPADLVYFKRVTMGCPIIMGRKTFESIGRPLPGRRNIILTRNTEYEQEGCEIIHSMTDIAAIASHTEGELFIIGGAEIFKEALPLADRLYITHIHETFEGDTCFPSFDEADWDVVSKEQGIRNEANPYDYSFVVYEKKK